MGEWRDIVLDRRCAKIRVVRHERRPAYDRNRGQPAEFGCEAAGLEPCCRCGERPLCQLRPLVGRQPLMTQESGLLGRHARSYSRAITAPWYLRPPTTTAAAAARRQRSMREFKWPTVSGGPATFNSATHRAGPVRTGSRRTRPCRARGCAGRRGSGGWRAARRRRRGGRTPARSRHRGSSGRPPPSPGP